jgi:hypothetical protein
VGGLSCRGSAVVFLRGSFLHPPCKDVINQSYSSWTPSGCKVNGSDQGQRQNGDRDAEFFLLFLVNLWTQVRGQCFSAKAVSKYLLY